MDTLESSHNTLNLILYDVLIFNFLKTTSIQIRFFVKYIIYILF